MKKILSLVALLVGASLAGAQGLATLTGTVTDSDSKNWDKAVVTFSLTVPGGGNPVNKQTGANVPNNVKLTLSTAGAFTGSNQITRTDYILPNGSTWTATACSYTSGTCSTVGPITIAAGSFNMGTYLSSNITAPRFNAFGVVYGYGTVEVASAIPGATLYNTTTGASPACNLYNGSTWISCDASPPTPPAGPSFAVQIANSGATAFASDPNITEDTTAHALLVGGTIGGNKFTLNNLSSILSSWTFDVTSPATALNSLAPIPTSLLTGTFPFASLSGNLALPQISAQAADTVLQNATGSSAAPTAVAMPTCGPGSADLYNTTSHAWSCVTFGSTSRTCNANGCYTSYPDGTQHMWGSSSAVTGTPSAQALTITFPTSFITQVDAIEVTSSSNATGDGNPHPSDCHVTRSTVNTTGATAIITIPTQVGGSGYAALATGDVCSYDVWGH